MSPKIPNISGGSGGRSAAYTLFTAIPVGWPYQSASGPELYTCASRSGMQYIFTCILPAGSRILSVRMGEPRPWLAPDTHGASCTVIHGPWPGTVRLLVTTWTVSLAPVTVRLAPPGTASLAPGVKVRMHRSHAQPCVWHHRVCMASLAPGTVSPGTGDGKPEPGTRDQGAPGTADGRARDGTSAGNNMDLEPGTGDGKLGTRDGAVQFTCVHARLLNKFTLVRYVVP